MTTEIAKWGGKRKGVGRKPNSTEASLLPLPSPQGVDYQTFLALLPEDHRENPERKFIAVRLMAAGYTPTAVIAQLPGLSKSTLRHWRDFSWWQDALELCLQSLALSPHAAFLPRLPKSLEVLDNHLEKDNLVAALKVQDRIYGETVKQVHSEGVHIVYHYIDSPGVSEPTIEEIAREIGRG